MMKKSGVRRKTFVAREDLLNRLVEVAKTQGCSLFELVNDLFQLEIVSEELNFSLKRVVDERKIIETAKGAGFVLGLESLWYEMADIAYRKEKRSALKSWFDAGVWFATRYISNGTRIPLDLFKDDLTAFTWNAPECDFEVFSDKAIVKVTSPRFNEAYTFLFASFILGAMEKFGYKPVSQEVSRGLIRIETVRDETHGST